jgi:hypothetical protein
MRPSDAMSGAPVTLDITPAARPVQTLSSEWNTDRLAAPAGDGSAEYDSERIVVGLGVVAAHFDRHGIDAIEIPGSLVD